MIQFPKLDLKSDPGRCNESTFDDATHSFDEM